MNLEPMLDEMEAEMKKALDSIVKDYEKKCLQVLEPVLLKTFEEDDKLEHILVIGYTPDFNDGEETEHSSEVYANGWDAVGDLRINTYTGAAGIIKEYISNEYYDSEGYVEVDIGEHKIPINDDTGEVLPMPAGKHISCSSVLDYMCEKLYKTNYAVEIKMIDGKISITKKDYDCGH